MHFGGNVSFPIKRSDLEVIQQQHSFTKAEIKRLWSSEHFRSQSHSLPSLVPGSICSFLLARRVSDSSQSAPTDLSCPKKPHWWLSMLCFGKHSLGEIFAADPTPPAAEAISSLTKTESGVWTVCQTWGLAFFFFLSLLKRRMGEEDLWADGAVDRDSEDGSLCWFFPPLRNNEWWVLIRKTFG